MRRAKRAVESRIVIIRELEENDTTHFLESHKTVKKKNSKKKNAETHYVDSKHPLEDHGEKKIKCIGARASHR
jgi:hypothetical protein